MMTAYRHREETLNTQLFTVYEAPIVDLFQSTPLALKIWDQSTIGNCTA